MMQQSNDEGLKDLQQNVYFCTTNQKHHRNKKKRLLQHLMQQHRNNKKKCYMQYFKPTIATNLATN